MRGRIFWYLVKSYLFSVWVYSSVRWSSQFLRVARNHGHVDLPGCTVYNGVIFLYDADPDQEFVPCEEKL